MICPTCDVPMLTEQPHPAPTCISVLRRRCAELGELLAMMTKRHSDLAEEVVTPLQRQLADAVRELEQVRKESAARDEAILREVGLTPEVVEQAYASPTVDLIERVFELERQLAQAQAAIERQRASFALSSTDEENKLRGQLAEVTREREAAMRRANIAETGFKNATWALKKTTELAGRAHGGWCQPDGEQNCAACFAHDALSHLHEGL